MRATSCPVLGPWAPSQSLSTRGGGPGPRPPSSRGRRLRPLDRSAPHLDVLRFLVMTFHRLSVPVLARRMLAPLAALLGLVAGLSIFLLPPRGTEHRWPHRVLRRARPDRHQAPRRRAPQRPEARGARPGAPGRGRPAGELAQDGHHRRRGDRPDRRTQRDGLPPRRLQERRARRQPRGARHERTGLHVRDLPEQQRRRRLLPQQREPAGDQLPVPLTVCAHAQSDRHGCRRAPGAPPHGPAAVPRPFPTASPPRLRQRRSATLR